MTANSEIFQPQNSLSFGRTGQRILAVHFPKLATDRILRRRWGLSWRLTGHRDETPLVCAGRRENAVRLTAIDENAARIGLKCGQGLTEARAICPSLLVIEEDQAADRRFLEALADWCDRYTPLVALEGSDGLFLDITGSSHLFGGEQALLAELSARLLAMGLEAHAAISPSPGLSSALARFGGKPIVEAQEAEDVLAPLPLAALRIEASTIQALAKVGLKQIGDLLSAPRAPMVRRFGAELLVRLDQALGRDEEAISPRLPVASLSAERRLAEPIQAEEHLLSLARQLAEGLAPSLEARGAGGRLFELVLFRVDGQVFRLKAGASTPLRDKERIARLFAERLQAVHDDLDAGFGFEILRLNVLRHEPFDARQGDFEDNDRRQHSLAEFVDQVSARLGADCLQTYQLRQSHIPERAVVPVAAIEHLMVRKPMREAAPLHRTAERPLRLFTHPEPLEAYAAEVPDGPPVRFRWRRLNHKVSRAEGPERIATEWWLDALEDEDGKPKRMDRTRDYFRLECETGERFWVYREGLYDQTPNPRWYMHGIFA